MKYIVETIGMTRMIHVVEAKNEDEAMDIAHNADDNWQEYLGEVKVDIAKYTPERIKHFEGKDFFWQGTSYKDENGNILYDHKKS